MSRAESILAELEAARTVPADQLASALDVTRRTLKGELTALQHELGTAAQIVTTDGGLRLMVADPKRFRAVKAALASDQSLNDPTLRAAHLVARLFRAAAPITVDDLAADLAVGRSTVHADLAQLRQEFAAGIEIEGRTNVGLTLTGDEFALRLHVLRHLYPTAYPKEPWHGDVARIVEREAADADLDDALASELTRWAIVAVDRNRLGLGVEEVPARYAGLDATPAHELAARVVEGLRAEHRLTDGEAVFLTLPVAGMRAPASAAAAERFGTHTSLADEIFGHIAQRMDIDLRGSRHEAEFTRHIDYLVNRMRYGIWADEAVGMSMASEYPVAHEMATLTCQLLERRVGLPVEGSERDLLATYFQLFLSAPRTERRAAPAIVVVARTGRVTAELIALQVRKLVPSNARIDVVMADDATPAVLDPADLVVVCGDFDVDTSAPVLQVTRMLDSDALQRQLERMPLHIPFQSEARSVLGSALREDAFFALPAGTDYHDALEYMAGHLQSKGLVDDGFAERLLAREADATMQLTELLAFPHTTVAGANAAVLAVATVDRADDEPGPRLIVCLGVPEDASRSEAALVAVYDVVLRLVNRPERIRELSRVTSFEDFYYTVEHTAVNERNR